MINQDPNSYKLLTPGPLTTSFTVREALLVDRCTWDDDYKEMTQDIRRRLLRLAHADNGEYSVVLMQGSGTFGVESALGTLPGADEKVLVLVNGAYSERQCKILSTLHMPYERLDFSWNQVPCAESVEKYLKDHPDIAWVSMVHSETTTGLLNDISSVAKVVKELGRKIIVDAMSSFGGVDIDVAGLRLDAIVSSANKCIQGVPGFSFIIARVEDLEASKGHAHSLSLDLYDQWKTLEKDNGKWRFTSPTHVVAAFHQALIEMEEQGGIPARSGRYYETNRLLREGMRKLGFTPYIDEKNQGPIITTFLYPEGNFCFKDMYAFLKMNGYVIYPGKLTQLDTFRLGNIGEIYPEDVAKILSLFEQYLKDAKASQTCGCKH